jgi:hypothetical protein
MRPSLASELEAEMDMCLTEELDKSLVFVIQIGNIRMSLDKQTYPRTFPRHPSFRIPLLDLKGYNWPEMHRIGKQTESLDLFIHGFAPRWVVSNIQHGAYVSAITATAGMMLYLISMIRFGGTNMYRYLGRAWMIPDICLMLFFYVVVDQSMPGKTAHRCRAVVDLQGMRLEVAGGRALVALNGVVRRG